MYREYLKSVLYSLLTALKQQLWALTDTDKVQVQFYLATWAVEGLKPAWNIALTVISTHITALTGKMLVSTVTSVRTRNMTHKSVTFVVVKDVVCIYSTSRKKVLSIVTKYNSHKVVLYQVGMYCACPPISRHASVTGFICNHLL